MKQFSSDELRVVAFQALANAKIPAEQFQDYFAAMKLLIDTAEKIPAECAGQAASASKEKPEKPTFSGYGAKLKKDTYDRMTAARKSGVTLNQIIVASGGVLTTQIITDMLNRKQVKYDKWEVLSVALDAIEQKGGADHGQ